MCEINHHEQYQNQSSAKEGYAECIVGLEEIHSGEYRVKQGLLPITK